MNLALKHALVDYPGHAYKVAENTGILYTSISKFISGVQKPTDEQKQALAKELNKPVKELFPQN